MSLPGNLTRGLEIAMAAQDYLLGKRIRTRNEVRQTMGYDPNQTPRNNMASSLVGDGDRRKFAKIIPYTYIDVTDDEGNVLGREVWGLCVVIDNSWWW